MSQSNLQKINEWKRVVEDVTSDITDLIENRFVFKRVVEIVNKKSIFSKIISIGII